MIWLRCKIINRIMLVALDRALPAGVKKYYVDLASQLRGYLAEEAKKQEEARDLQKRAPAEIGLQAALDQQPSPLVRQRSTLLHTPTREPAHAPPKASSSTVQLVLILMLLLNACLFAYFIAVHQQVNQRLATIERRLLATPLHPSTHSEL